MGIALLQDQSAFCGRGRHLRGRRGFTLLEVIVVITIGGILTAIAIAAFSRVHGQMGTRAAQDNFLSLHAQARALAVERGGLSQFVVDEDNDEIRVLVGGEVISQLSFEAEFGVTISAGGGFTQCFTPRGIAEISGSGTCSTISASDPTLVTFTRGERETQIRILPLGQSNPVTP